MEIKKVTFVCKTKHGEESKTFPFEKVIGFTENRKTGEMVLMLKCGIRIPLVGNAKTVFEQLEKKDGKMDG